ncbi:MAG: hypothetical protein DRP15_04145, partial [Candidatus Aenigmatarchaeota archaeon]
MKVVHLTKYFYPYKGGIEKYVMEIVKRSKKHQFIVIASSDDKRIHFNRFGRVKVLKLPRLWTVFHAPFTLPFVSVLRKLNPDIIHLHVPNPWFEFNLLVYKLLGGKGRVVVTYHSDIINYTPFHLLLNISRIFLLIPLLIISDVVIATSKNYVQSSIFLRSVRKKVRVIPIGVDEKRFKPTGRENEGEILFVGRLFPYKGLEYLVLAVGYVSREKKNFVVKIVGEGKERSKLEKMVKDMSLEKWIKFEGGVDEEEITRYYNSCCIFVLPSIHRSEAFGIAQLEAMSSGKPVISTRIKGSGVPWVNQDGVTGLVVPPRDPERLAKAILNLLGNNVMRKKMGKNARKKALSFSWETIAKKTIKVY